MTVFHDSSIPYGSPLRGPQDTPLAPASWWSEGFADHHRIIQASPCSLWTLGCLPGCTPHPIPSFLRPLCHLIHTCGILKGHQQGAIAAVSHSSWPRLKSTNSRAAVLDSLDISVARLVECWQTRSPKGLVSHWRTQCADRYFTCQPGLIVVGCESSSSQPG